MEKLLLLPIISSPRKPRWNVATQLNVGHTGLLADDLLMAKTLSHMLKYVEQKRYIEPQTDLVAYLTKLNNFYFTNKTVYSTHCLTTKLWFSVAFSFLLFSFFAHSKTGRVGAWIPWAGGQYNKIFYILGWCRKVYILSIYRLTIGILIVIKYIRIIIRI